MRVSSDLTPGQPLAREVSPASNTPPDHAGRHKNHKVRTPLAPQNRRSDHRRQTSIAVAPIACCYMQDKQVGANRAQWFQTDGCNPHKRILKSAFTYPPSSQIGIDRQNSIGPSLSAQAQPGLTTQASSPIQRTIPREFPHPFSCRNRARVSYFWVCTGAQSWRSARHRTPVGRVPGLPLSDAAELRMILPYPSDCSIGFYR